MNNKLMFSSNSNEWETPQDLFDSLDMEFSFNIDVCAKDNNAKCKKYFTPEMDGLNQEWRGVCWMNPPYSESKKWIEKAYNESRKNNCIVVGLLPSRTDTIAFHKWIYHKAQIRFLKGRLKFSNSKHSAPFPSMIIIWGKD